ncbi:nucleotide pyrophosphohydrolase [Patescibacteria group bacterium]|nr:nucleotide pyrophosphohydrolase [Patescibacteria group bacterium]
MNISELQNRAIAIREAYDEINLQDGYKWDALQTAQAFVGDVGDLQKLAMAKAGLRKIDDLDAKIRHELSDCLWSILVLSDMYGIDLEAEFVKTMNELEERISK